MLASVLFQVAIYSRDIAPVLALHCNRCHGDDFSGGGVDTRTYESLERTANLELLLELIEGRRGPTQRMPRDAPPLSAATIDLVRKWVRSGAPFDHEPAGERLTREIGRKPEIRFEVSAAGRSYVVIEIQDHAGNLAYREASVIEDKQQWRLPAARHWPSKIVLVVNVRYASGPAKLDILP